MVMADENISFISNFTSNRGDLRSAGNYSFIGETPGDRRGIGIQTDIRFATSNPYVDFWEANTTQIVVDDSTSSSACEWNITANVSTCNITQLKATPSSFLSPFDTWQVFLFAILSGGCSLVTILGNLIVILSFILERQIRQPTNYFIASLACSDLLIGTFSMPFYTVYLLMGKSWPLGVALCDLWLALDYTVCLTSIYTVFFITIDRFCSVKIPAKYRGWRTERRVNIMVACTWVIPITVFFTSIIGWQFFVGQRTVPENKCYVQFMESALFNTVLTIGYFWVTLFIICILYTGIYKVALDLQRKSEAKQKKMTSLVSMAGQTMTKIGIGMSKQPLDTKKLVPVDFNSKLEASMLQTQIGTTSTTSFTSETRHPDKEEEKSSSVACGSDTDPSSQSPKRSSAPPKNSDKRNASPNLNKFEIPPPPPPPTANNILSQMNSTHGQHKVTNKSNFSSNHVANIKDFTNHNDSNVGDHKLATSALDFQSFHGTFTEETKTPNDCSLTGSVDPKTPNGNPTNTIEKPSTLNITISSDPELLEGVRYIDQESLKSLKSNDNLRLLVEPFMTNNPAGIIEGPESPVWKKRDTFPHKDIGNNTLEPDYFADSSRSANKHSAGCSVTAVTSLQQQHASAANIQVETMEDDTKTISKLAKPDEIQPLNAGETKSPTKKGKHKSSHGPLRNLVKGVGSRRGKGSRGKKEKKSKAENRARKALRTITFILGAFVLCWTPYHILVLIMGFCPDNSGCVDETFYDISYFLCYLNSPLNPMCYAFANQQFKKTFIRIIKLDWHKT